MYYLASARTQNNLLHPLVTISIVACFIFAFIASSLIAWHYYKKFDDAYTLAVLLNDQNLKLRHEVDYWKQGCKDNEAAINAIVSRGR